MGKLANDDCIPLRIFYISHIKSPRLYYWAFEVSKSSVLWVKQSFMGQHRKEFLRNMGMGLMATGATSWSFANNNSESTVDIADFSGDGNPEDEKYWKHIAKKYYPVSKDYLNLENGYFGVQSTPVLQAFQKNTLLVNTELARFTRKEYPQIAREVKKTLAAFLQVSDEEIIITRNATEALNVAIQGYPFKPDDEVLINQLDYFSMIETFRMLEKRGRLKVNAFEMPLLPANDDEIVATYQKMITPKTKVILLTHVSNITGLIIPVAKIAAMARKQGIDIMCDSAHALGQVPFQLRELGSDFVGMNLHKWMGNPIGAGVLYIKKERVPEMTAMFGDATVADSNINKLAHFGTTPPAVIMTIPDSIAFHQMMDINKITKRLHFLKSIWVEQFKNHSIMEVVVPGDAQFSCAIASFRPRKAKAAAVADYLWNEHKILTVQRTLGEDGCVRVTPSVYTSAEDVKKFVRALNAFNG